MQINLVMIGPTMETNSNSSGIFHPVILGKQFERNNGQKAYTALSQINSLSQGDSELYLKGIINPAGGEVHGVEPGTAPLALADCN